MKKLLILITLIILTIPTLTHAGFDDSSFTTDAVIQIGSYTLNIVGTSTSIVINDTNLVATLEASSSIIISSPTRNQLTTDVSTGVTNTCNSSVSQIVITGSTTVIITPTATICADTVVSTPQTPSSSGSSGTRYIPRALTSTTTIPTITTYTFTRDLTIGTTDTDVMKLQQFLNAKGYNVTKLGEETTYFGNKTKESLMKFQKANSIQATGNLGPITRTLINKLLTNINTTPTSTTFTRDLTLGSEGDDVTRLQTILHTQGYLTVSPTGYFGNLTLQALIKYQKANNITPALGYFGPLTRTQLSK